MPKILIADDSRFHLALLTSSLESKGFEVLAAQDGLQASMLALRTQPNAIILDLSMPGGSGLEVLRRLKRSAKTKSIPVIVVTADSEPSTREYATLLGAVEFLNKPVDLDQLARRLFALTNGPTSADQNAKSAKAATCEPTFGANPPSKIPAKPSRSWQQIVDDVLKHDGKQQVNEPQSLERKTPER
jgi:CheY-like chemotaxis protein